MQDAAFWVDCTIIFWPGLQTPVGLVITLLVLFHCNICKYNQFFFAKLSSAMVSFFAGHEDEPTLCFVVTVTFLYFGERG